MNPDDDRYSDNEDIDRLAKETVEILFELQRTIERLTLRVTILEAERAKRGAWLN